MVWREGEARIRFEIKLGSIYSPADLMYHGHFNTGTGYAAPLRRCAGEAQSSARTGTRTKLHEMIPFDEEPPEIHREFVEELKRNGVSRECPWLRNEGI